MYEADYAQDVARDHFCKICATSTEALPHIQHKLDYYSLQPMTFNERYRWIWLFLGPAYIGVAVAFVMINNPTDNSPN